MCIGLAFWKAPKRKFFAVPLKNQPQVSTRKTAIEYDESDAGEPKRARLETIDKNLTSLNERLDDLKSDVAKVLEVNRGAILLLGLYKALSDVLKCKICHNVPMKPPLIYTRCCKAILGCETCVNMWYDGDDALTKPCPLCRQARGYNETLRILGFDDFSATIEKLFSSPTSSDHITEEH